MARTRWAEWSATARARAVVAVVAVVALPLLATLVSSAGDLGPLGPPSLYLLAVVAAAALGGLASGLAAAVVSFLGLNYYFTAPRHTLRVGKPQDVVALVVFLVVATIVGALFARALAERQRAERREEELRLLNRLATRLLSAELSSATVQELAQAVAEQLGLTTCAVEVTDDPDLSAAVRPLRIDDAQSLEVPIASGAKPLGTLHVARARGAAELTVADHRVLQALAGLLGLAIERQHLDAEARAARTDAEVSEIRAALFSSVTHDFRTPLASIKAGITSLAKDDVAYDLGEREELAATVLEEADRLNRLVDNLLDLARARAGEIVIEKELTPFDDVVETVLARLRGVLSPFHVIAQIDEELPGVWVDPVQMDQALTNIIENAARHSPDGADISVAVTATRDGIGVRVADHGPGIPEDERELVFEPFYRGRADGRRPGSGLGLAIARAVVTAHRGTIRIEPGADGGTAVVIELPVGEPAAR